MCWRHQGSWQVTSAAADSEGWVVYNLKNVLNTGSYPQMLSCFVSLLHTNCSCVLHLVCFSIVDFTQKRWWRMGRELCDGNSRAQRGKDFWHLRLMDFNLIWTMQTGNYNETAMCQVHHLFCDCTHSDSGGFQSNHTRNTRIKSGIVW